MNTKLLKIGDEAPLFCLPDKENNAICPEQFRGKWIVVYFYPKDNTQGCTLEGIDFSKSLNDFKNNNAIIVGISPDTPDCHLNFAKKHDLTVILLSDPGHEVIEMYGVWHLKKRYGREYYGIERSTFLINPDGIIEYIWRKVKVDGHVKDVFQKLQDTIL